MNDAVTAWLPGMKHVRRPRSVREVFLKKTAIKILVVIPHEVLKFDQIVEKLGLASPACICCTDGQHKVLSHHQPTLPNILFVPRGSELYSFGKRLTFRDYVGN
jgi:hypothetical protein